MSDNPVDKGSGGVNAPFRTAGSWFAFLVFFLSLWIGAYLYTHMESVRTGYQVTQFSSSHIDQLNRILYNGSIPIAQAPQIRDTSITDSTRADSTKAVNAGSQQPTYVMQVCDDTCKINKALLYVRTEFDNKLQPDQEDVIKAYIRTFNAQEVGSYLAQLKLKVSSYFWLSGPWMYLEMIFWVIFGVICSNLFALGNIGRTRGFASFDPREVPYQIAKFFYAPFCAIIIILTYNYIKHKDVIQVSSSEGIIVFAFIIGLFSGRMMSFLERFKDALLPETVRNNNSDRHTTSSEARKMANRPEVADQKSYDTVVVKPSQVSDVEIEPKAKEENQPVINDLYKEKEKAEQEREALEALSTSMAFIAEEQDDNEDDEPAQPVSEGPEVLPQVVVVLNLDVSGLYEEEKDEILDVGFVNAVVTMHNVNGRDIVTARKSDDKYTASFVAPDVKSGIYIVRCTLTQKLSDDYVINLFGEKTVFITSDNTVLELFIKKYEAID